jgi:SOS response regulatory protein OraA/RecX
VLERAGFEPAACEVAVERMRALGYVDDARFATSRADALASRGAGDHKIEHDLERHGVDAELRASALDALEPERARAERIVEHRRADRTTARLLASRGFSPDTIAVVIADPETDAVG